MKDDFTDATKETETQRLGKLYPIILADYNSEYPKLYLVEKIFLQSVFGDNILRISHIGSTTVPNIISKPIIDILLEIKENTHLTEIIEKLTNSGYIVNRPPNDLIMFIKGYGGNGFEGQVYHIHVRELGDYNELYFRDYLIDHPETAKEYGELKQKLFKEFEHDRDGYTYGKSDFINRVANLARNELSDNYKYIAIETHISETLTGETKSSALDFIEHLKSNNMFFERAKGYWENQLYFMVSYQNKYVCFILLDGKGEEEKFSPLTIWSDDSDSDWYERLVLSDAMKEIASANVDICCHCGGCSGGTSKIISGKSFNNVCRTTFRFVNPDIKDFDCLKIMVDLRKKDIEMR